MIHKHDPVTPLNNLFITIDRSYGARTLGYDFLSALKQTLKAFEFNDDPKKVRRALEELSQAVYDSRPRIALILRYEREVLDFVQTKKDFELMDIIKFIENLEDQMRVRSNTLIDHGTELIKKNSTILLHSSSHTVFKILASAIEKGGIPEKIIIAGQDEQKTNALIKKVKQLNVPFFVVPEFVVSHIEREIDFALFGALTFNCHDEFVMSPGSNAVISELNNLKVPCYIAMETDKFSLWKDQKKHHTLKSIHMHTTKDQNICYEKLIFSHDRVPLNWITGIVTEHGLSTPAKIKKMYTEMLAAQS